MNPSRIKSFRAAAAGIFLFVAFMLASLAMRAQELTFDKQVIILDTVVKLEVTRGIGDVLSFNVKKDTDSVAFEMTSRSYDIFRNLFSKALDELYFHYNDTLMKKQVERVAPDLYVGIMLSLNVANEETPPSGYLDINPNVPLEPLSTGKIPCRKINRVDTLFRVVQRVNKECRRIRILLDTIKKADSTTFVGNEEYFQSISSAARILEDEILNTLKSDTIKPESVRAMKKIQPARRKEIRVLYTRRELKKNIIHFRECERYLAAFYFKALEVSELQGASFKMRNDKHKIQDQMVNNVRSKLDTIRVRITAVVSSLDKFEANLGKSYSIIKKNAEEDKKHLRTAAKNLGKAWKTDIDIEHWPVTRKQLVNSMDYILRNSSDLENTLQSFSETRKTILTDLNDRVDSAIEENDRWADSIVLLHDSIAFQKNLPKSVTRDSLLKKYRADSLKVVSLQKKSYLLLLQLEKQKEACVRSLSTVSAARELINVLNDSVSGFMNYIKVLSNQARKLEKLDKDLTEKTKKLSELQNDALLHIDSLKMEFCSDLIKNIFIHGTYGGRKMIFVNSIPIQFSTIRNFQDLGKRELTDYSGQYRLKLSEAITYSPELYLQNENYCPADSVYTFKLEKDPEHVKIMYKEKASRLFEFKTYTDFVGYAEDQPNGIIQMEVSKRIPLWVTPIVKSRKSGFFITFFNFYDPNFVLAKLDQHNKILTATPDDTLKPPVTGTARPLDIYKYSNLRLDPMRLNLVNMDLTVIKTSFEWNMGFVLLHTPVTLTDTTDHWGALSGFPYSELKIRLKRDDRWGCTFQTSMGKVLLWDEKLTLDNGTTVEDCRKWMNNWLLSYQFDVFYRPTKKRESAIFFRVNNTHSLESFKINYLQLQLGYAINIMNPVKKSAAKKQ